jgi:hypothetical protein
VTPVDSGIHRLADRDQHLGACRLQRQRPTHHQPRKPILDHGQPGSNKPPAAGRQHVNVELGVVGLPDLVARAGLPAPVDGVATSAILAVTSVRPLRRGEISLQRIAEHRARRHPDTLVAKQPPRRGRSPSAAVQRLHRRRGRPPAGSPDGLVSTGGEPPPHGALMYTGRPGRCPHDRRRQPPIVAKRGQPRHERLSLVRVPATHGQFITDQADGLLARPGPDLAPVQSAPPPTVSEWASHRNCQTSSLSP